MHQKLTEEKWNEQVYYSELETHFDDMQRTIQNIRAWAQEALDGQSKAELLEILSTTPSRPLRSF